MRRNGTTEALGKQAANDANLRQSTSGQLKFSHESWTSPEPIDVVHRIRFISVESVPISVISGKVFGCISLKSMPFMVNQNLNITGPKQSFVSHIAAIPLTM